MEFDRKLLEQVEELEARPFRRRVYRHTFAEIEPERPRIRAARWNPDEVAAIYCAFDRETCLAEADYYIGLQSVPVDVQRNVYTIELALDAVVDLTDLQFFKQFVPQFVELSDLQWSDCWPVGGAVHRLGYDGLMVPSVRYPGTNLVVFFDNQGLNYEFTVTNREIIPLLS